VTPTAAGHDFATFRFDLVERREHVAHSLGCHERSHQGRRIERIAHPHLLVRAYEPLGQLAGDLPLRDDAPRGGAPLARGADGPEEDRAGRELEVRVLGHDDGVVPTELEDGAAEAPGDGRSDMLAHLRGSRERDERQAAIAEHPFPDGPTRANRQREHAAHAVIGHHAVRHVLDGDRAERRRPCGLPHDRIATDGCEGAVPRPDRDGEVERGDDAHHAERMPLLHHAVSRALRRNRQPVQLAREARGEVADVDHLLHFAVALGADLPHLERHEIAERLFQLPQRVPQVAHELSALGGRRHAPRGERRGGVSNHRVVGVRRGLQHARDGLTRRRVVRHELLSARLSDPPIRARARAGVDVLDLQLCQQRRRGHGRRHEVLFPAACSARRATSQFTSGRRR
jgi:hypothetical protein